MICPAIVFLFCYNFNLHCTSKVRVSSSSPSINLKSLLGTFGFIDPVAVGLMPWRMWARFKEAASINYQFLLSWCCHHCLHVICVVLKVFHCLLFHGLLFPSLHPQWFVVVGGFVTYIYKWELLCCSDDELICSDYNMFSIYILMHHIPVLVGVWIKNLKQAVYRQCMQR